MHSFDLTANLYVKLQTTLVMLLRFDVRYPSLFQWQVIHSRTNKNTMKKMVVSPVDKNHTEISK